MTLPLDSEVAANAGCCVWPFPYSHEWLHMQGVHDAALQQGLQCALENMGLRAELAAAAMVQAEAVELARAQAASEAAASKLHLQAK